MLLYSTLQSIDKKGRKEKERQEELGWTGGDFQRVEANMDKVLCPRVRYLVLVMGVRRSESADGGVVMGEISQVGLHGYKVVEGLYVLRRILKFMPCFLESR